MKCLEEAAHVETCLAMVAAVAVADTWAEQDDNHGVDEATPVAAGGGEELGESSLTQIELDGWAQKVFDESAGGQGEREEKIRCSETLHQYAEGSLRMAGLLPNNDDLAGIVQVEVKVWTP